MTTGPACQVEPSLTGLTNHRSQSDMNKTSDGAPADPNPGGSCCLPPGPGPRCIRAGLAVLSVLSGCTTEGLEAPRQVFIQTRFSAAPPTRVVGGCSLPRINVAFRHSTVPKPSSEEHQIRVCTWVMPEVCAQRVRCLVGYIGCDGLTGYLART